jgi:hypothetical protein
VNSSERLDNDEREENTMSENGKKTVRRRPSLFWPVLFIAVGILLLLDNLGMLPGDTWDNLIRLWPVLLIALGLDSIWRRQGVAGATLMIGIGVVFLLSNFGYLSVNVWQVIFNLWPLLLIAVGFDILIGSRSWLASVFGLVLMLALLVASLWLLNIGAVSTSSAQVRQISQGLDGAQQAHVVIEPGVGSLDISAMAEPTALVAGTLPSEQVMKISQNFEMEGDTAIYRLSATGGNYVFPGSADLFSWDLELAPELPIDLEVELGAGDMNLKLTELVISTLKLDFGVSAAEINLPDQGGLDGTIDAAIGQVIIRVPSDVGLRVRKDTAIVIVNFPDDYRQSDGVYTSPNYASADQRIDLQIDMAIGRIVIREQ